MGGGIGGSMGRRCRQRLAQNRQGQACRGSIGLGLIHGNGRAHLLPQRQDGSLVLGEATSRGPSGRRCQLNVSLICCCAGLFVHNSLSLVAADPPLG